jgi:hypothetical protein
MNSPDEDPKALSELDYAPPWAREQAARDQFRATLRHSGEAAVEPKAQNDAGIRSFGDDRPWHQRALEPELVPEPPAGVSNLWPMMLRMGAVCIVAALVAGAVVFLFSPKPTVHKVAQANALAPATAADDAPSSIDASQALPAGVPALAIETSAPVTAPAQDQVAIATPQTPQQQVAAATPPQLPQIQVIIAPQSKPEIPAPQIASVPPPNSSPANIRPSPAPGPAANEPAPRPADANPAATDPKPAGSAPPSAAPAPTAPAQAAPRSAPKPAVVLDENEINTLIRRGKNLLNDGDFAAARVLFERAANAGSAEAALALGSTYDPNVIKRLGAIMVRPDIESARKWYQLAAERGSAAASLQLANLPQGR